MLNSVYVHGLANSLADVVSPGWPMLLPVFGFLLSFAAIVVPDRKASRCINLLASLLVGIGFTVFSSYFFAASTAISRANGCKPAVPLGELKEIGDKEPLFGKIQDGHWWSASTSMGSYFALGFAGLFISSLSIAALGMIGTGGIMTASSKGANAPAVVVVQEAGNIVQTTQAGVVQSMPAGAVATTSQPVVMQPMVIQPTGPPMAQPAAGQVQPEVAKAT